MNMMMKCLTCGCEVDCRASSCPKCGRPWPLKPVYVMPAWAQIALVVGIGTLVVVLFAWWLVSDPDATRHFQQLNDMIFGKQP